MKQGIIQNVEKLVYWVSHRTLPGDISPQDREDAVHDAIVAVLNVQSKADPEKNLRSLVNIRMRGALKDFMKKKVKSCRYYVDTEPEDTAYPQERTPESRVTKKDLAMQARIMMYGLQEDQRLAVEDYYLKGRNIQEVAGDLGVSASTAWRLVKSGVSELRDSMAEYHTNGVNWKC